MTSPRAPSVVKWVVLTTLVVASGLAAVFLVRWSRPTVTVTEVVIGPAVQAFYATGTLEPADREHPVRTPVDGFVHAAIHNAPDAGRPYVDKGDRVTRGQVLAVVYNEQFQQAFDRAAADAVEKRARADGQTSPVLQELDAKIAAYGDLVGAATREFKRYSAGMEAGAANQADFDRALDRLKTVTSDFESFKAQKLQAKLKLDRELAEAESALKTATWNLEQTKVVSPIDGYVLDMPQQLGTRVAANDLLVTVADTSPANLVMRAQVDEEDVTKVFQPDAAGNPTTAAAQQGGSGRPQVVRMSLYAFADEVFVGRVTRIYPKADPERRTFEVDIAIANPSPRMQAGMTGELAFETASKDRTLVAPSQAVQDGKIWTIRDGRLTASAAEVGLRGVERVEVVSGLQPGDAVVISPVAGLAPGAAVRVGERMDPIAAAGLNKPKKKEVFRGGF